MLRSARFASLASLLVVLAGCNGSNGPYGFPPQGTVSNAPPPVDYFPPNPVFATLELEITNSSSAFMNVTASSEDQVASIGPIAPGETIAFDLGEMPDYVLFTATATTTDAWGDLPIYPGVTVRYGVDYSPTSPFVGVEWGDEVRGTDRSDEDGSGFSVAPGATAGTSTGKKTVRKVEHSPKARTVQPSLASRTPATPTSIGP